MPKISDLPTISTPADADELVLNDESASTTKKITWLNVFTAIQAGLQAVVGWISTAMIADGAVTPDKVSPVYTILNRATDLNIGSSSWTNFNMTNVVYDNSSGAFWDASDHNRINIPEDGYYSLNMWLCWSNSGTGTLRALRIMWNAGAGDYRDISDYRHPVPFNNKNHISLEFRATAGEYFLMDCYQNSGATLQIASTADYNTATKVSIRRISA